MQSANAMRFRSKSIKSIVSGMRSGRVAPIPLQDLVPMEPPHEPEQQRGGGPSRSVWTALLVLSAVALIAVVSFGSGIVAERYLLAATGWARVA